MYIHVYGYHGSRRNCSASTNPCFMGVAASLLGDNKTLTTTRVKRGPHWLCLSNVLVYRLGPSAQWSPPTSRFSRALCPTLALSYPRRAVGASAQPQSGLYTNFPFCKCIKTPTAYRLSPTVKSVGSSTYCFTLNVNVPAGCNNYCCNKADLKKIEVRRS